MSIKRPSLDEQTKPSYSHNFSGWPGAWCFNCGSEDAREICVGTHDHGSFPVTEDDPYGLGPICQNGPCPEPGSNRHNPYMPWRRS